MTPTRAPSVSVSTRAIAPKPPQQVRTAIRRRQAAEPLAAYQLTEDDIFQSPNGLEELEGHPGDWVIVNGTVVIDVVTDAAFQRRFEPVDSEGLVLSGQHQTRLARHLGLGSTETADHVTAAVARLAQLRIGEIDVDFTPGQWEALKHRAEKRGLSVDALMRQIVDKITQDLWTV